MNTISADCPFCGAGRDSLHVEHDDGKGWNGKLWVECEECGARGPYLTFYGGLTQTASEAVIAAWNKQQPANVRPAKT